MNVSIPILHPNFSLFPNSDSNKFFRYNSDKMQLNNMGDFNKEDLHKIRQLENELKEVKKELDQLKAEGGGAVGNDHAMMVKRLAQLEMVDRARRFFNTLPPPNTARKIVLKNGHKFTPDIEAFIRKGAAYCRDLAILRGPNDSAFHGQPPDFFDNLIKHFHETENPDEMVASVNIALALDNPAPWPPVLVQLHVADLGLIRKKQLKKDGVPTLTEENVDYGDTMVEYTMSNKHKPEARFKLCIYFEGGAKCHQQMTRFTACRTDITTFSVSGSEFEQGEGERKLEAELQELKAKNWNLEKEMGEVKNQLNEINHQQIDLIAAEYARLLSAADSDSNGDINLFNRNKYTPEMDIFLRYGAIHCRSFTISRDTRTSGGTFVGYPAGFFDDLIKHYYETKVPAKAVRHLCIDLPLENPATWPTALLQPQAGEMNVEKVAVNNVEKWVRYILHNKHNPGIAFELHIHSEEGAKCYQQMTHFRMRRL